MVVEEAGVPGHVGAGATRSCYFGSLNERQWSMSRIQGTRIWRTGDNTIPMVDQGILKPSLFSPTISIYY